MTKLTLPESNEEWLSWDMFVGQVFFFFSSLDKCDNCSIRVRNIEHDQRNEI